METIIIWASVLNTQISTSVSVDTKIKGWKKFQGLNNIMILILKLVSQYVIFTSLILKHQRF